MEVQGHRQRINAFFFRKENNKQRNEQMFVLSVYNAFICEILCLRKNVVSNFFAITLSTQLLADFENWKQQ